MRIYLNEHPRTFVVADSAFSLIVRHPNPKYKLHSQTHRHVPHIHNENSKLNKRGSNSKDRSYLSNKVIVEFVSSELLDLSSFTDITPSKSRHNKQLHGFLGFLNVKGNIHLGFITRASKVASPKLGESILRVDDVDFYCLNNDQFDGWINKNDEDYLSQQQVEDSDQPSTGYPAASVKKLLSLGHFHYSEDFDMTSNLQERGFSGMKNHMLSANSPYFKNFMWNSFMISEFIEFRGRLNPHEKQQFDTAGFLTIITRGYAKTVNTTLLNNDHALLTLISKQSCMKRGPLFGDWGCDDEGSVSNFAETEVIVYSEKFCFSYVIIRGNVPSFWELQYNFSKKNIISSKKNKRIVFTRSFEASQHAFARHFDKLGNQFGDVHVVNCLLQDPSTYKGQLNDNFKQHLATFGNSRDKSVEKLIEDSTGSEAETNNSPSSNYRITETDMPLSTAFMKKVGYSATNPNELVQPLTKTMIDFGAMFFELKKHLYVGKQLGVFRVNSFDCLSKANFISKIISQEVLELAFRDMHVQVNHDLHMQHAKLWSENDDALKKLTINYQSSNTKVPTSSKPSSIKLQLTKKYLNVVGELKPNEVAMLKLLGRIQDQESVILYNPLHQYLSQELNKKSKEFVFTKDIKIFACTFNVNGSVSDDQNLKELIFPSKHQVDQSYDLVFFGFEEIVELTPGKMINIKSDNLIAWEKNVKKILNENGPKNEKYVSLWSEQMGGIAILLFVKESLIDNISSIEGSIKKTGLGGMSANKGGIAISLSYSKTQICFVCAHLAAGLNNLDERHQNYKTLAKGITFSKNRKIRDHDAVIWLGDFNFRIGLQNDTVKSLIDSKQYHKLFEYDQLNKQMANGETFPFFDEMEIKFPPTYKFDNNTKTYDSSDKQRIPAWTDRILSLSRGKILKQEVYDCDEEITFSDHRPVYAIFKASVNMINEAVKKEISNDIYESYKKEIGDINILVTGKDVTRFVTDVGDDLLPPPSSDTTKWWLEGGAAAKVTIPEFQNGDIKNDESYIINPRMPANPFIDGDELELIRRADVVKIFESGS